MEHHVCYKNEPFRAHIHWEDGKEETCTPAVLNVGGGLCGIALYSSDDVQLASDYLKKGDLVTAWRATEVVRLLPVIQKSTLHGAYCAASRQPCRDDFKNYARPTIERIGKAAHQEIMQKPVPSVIVTEIIESQGRAFPFELKVLGEEIRAGTVPWQPAFAQVGLRRPGPPRVPRYSEPEPMQVGRYLRGMGFRVMPEPNSLTTEFKILWPEPTPRLFLGLFPLRRRLLLVGMFSFTKGWNMETHGEDAHDLAVDLQVKLEQVFSRTVRVTHVSDKAVYLKD